MTKHYPEEFGEQGSHGHGHRLLAEAELPPGVVLDLGCATGPLAEPVAALGHEYVGADIDRAALDELTGRGFEAHELDLMVSEDDQVEAIEQMLRGRPLRAVLLLDVLEHLVDPAATVRALGRLAADHEGLQVVISIPNVTHVDVGIKLLLGRWDLTDIGLLDDTHIRFFNQRLVSQTLAAGGWVEAAADDVVNAFSDQLFPADAPALRPGAPLRQLLWRVRMGADPDGETYQFVRRYRHDPEAAAAVAARAGDETRLRGTDEVFLSVVVRAPGDDSAGLDRLLGDLARQPVDDVEVLVSHDPDHRPAVTPPSELASATRFVEAPAGTDWRDAAVGQAHGRYVALLDHRSRLSSSYLETLRQTVDALPGRVVQLAARVAPVADLAGVSTVDEAVDRLEPVSLDPLDLVGTVPFGSVALDMHAIPRQACEVNGLRFGIDEGDGAVTLFLLGAIELCGIVRSSEPVTVVHPSVLRDVGTDLDSLQKHLGLHPIVVPEGAGSQLLAFRHTVATVVPERDALAEELSAIRDQVGTLTQHLRSRDAELTELRGAWERRLYIRARRKLGRLKRRLLR